MGGHLMIHEKKGLCEANFWELLLGEEPSYLIIKFQFFITLLIGSTINLLTYLGPLEPTFGPLFLIGSGSDCWTIFNRS